MSETTAERRLRAWAEIWSRRDYEVVLARINGLSKMEIHEITGLARTTIDRILAKAKVE